jgi:hypothetical protein
MPRARAPRAGSARGLVHRPRTRRVFASPLAPRRRATTTAPAWSADSAAPPPPHHPRARYSAHPMRRALVTVAAVTLIVLAALVGRTLYSGTRALHSGDAAAARGDHPAAITAWSRAARWYLPFAPHVAAARERLADADPAAYARVLADTQAGGGRDVPWIATALVGLALWLGGCVHFARRAVDAEDRFVHRAAAASGALVLVGMVAWVVGLYNAWPAS